jgi:predicted nucleic acid-binding protein
MASLQMSECRIVLDTNVFVLAMAHAQEESRVYSLLLRKCCKVVVSGQITEEYQSVMNKFGYPGNTIFQELSRLKMMNKLRECDESPDSVSEDLAPRKDKHIVAPCLRGYTHYIISTDGGIKAKGESIRRHTGARVLDLQEAEREFNAKPDCRPNAARDR